MSDDTSRREKLRLLTEAVEQSPDSAEAHLKLGTAQQRAGRVAEAEANLRKAIELDPEQYQARINLGGVLFSRFDFAGSAEINAEAVALDPKAVQGHYNLGLAHLYMGNPEKVVECFQRVVELDPENAGGYYHLAAGLNAVGRVPQAKVCLLKSESLGFRPEPELIRAIDKALKQDGGEDVLTMEIGDGPGKKS